MKRRRLALGLAIGLLAYGAALVATVPATWVADGVERASQQRLVLRAPAGTAWFGSGELYIQQRSGPLLELGPLRWRVFSSSLLRGVLRAELALGRAKSVQLELSPASLALHGLDVTFPGAALATFAPALETFGPQGTIRVRSDSLRMERNSVLGLAQIEWREIRLARRQGLDLGSHVASIQGAGAKVTIELGTLEGQLQLSGGGAWEQAKGLRLSGAAAPRAESVVPFLKSVCAEYRDSRCLFRYEPPH